MARQGKNLRKYCDICRDGDTDLRCSQCNKVFHIDCLRNCNLLEGNTSLESIINSNDENNFCCPDCKNNEDFCFICRENETGDTMLYCDGCPKSAHLGCLGLNEEPDTPTWYCPNCDNDETGNCKNKNKQIGDVRTLGGTKKINDETDINSDTCYVCQKSGKLLGCDFCTYSYHPKCIETEVFAFDGDKWRCPVCRGEDPLKNMRHKRMNKTERLKLSQQWQACIKKQIKQSSINRDLFLWENREAIAPFVSRKVLERLKRNAESYRKNNAFSLPSSSSSSSKNMSKRGRKQKKSRIRKIQDDNSEIDSESESNPYGRKMKRMCFSESSSSESGGESDSIRNKSNKMRGKCKTKYYDNEKEDDDENNYNDDDSNENESEEGDIEYKEFVDAPKYREAHIKAKEQSMQILNEGIELKDYQRYGVHWLLTAFSIKGGAILADEMGLGKTIQTLTFLACLKALGITGPHLIVVPLSTVGNWAREARRFTSSLTLTKICGSRWEREHAMMDPVASDGLYDLYVTTYETVVTEESFFVDNFRWQCIILDEAHRIKNEGGRIRHSMDRVSGSMRVLLTGTPLQNSLKELFTLLNFLYPDILQDSEIFEKIFQMKDITKSASGGGSGNATSEGCNNSDMEENIDDLDSLGIKVDSKRIKLFHCLLQKLLLRRTKDLVIKLPDKIIKDIWLPLSPSSWLWYKRLLDVGNIHGDVSFRKLLGLVIKMRICCSHPRGLVARSSQLDKLFSVFAEASPELLNEVTDDAHKLKGSFGWEHVKGSSKLFFLDKLLMQLHRENCKYIPNYKESHEKYTREQIRSIKSRINELRNKGGAVSSSSTNTNSNNTYSSGSGGGRSKDKENGNNSDVNDEILSFEDKYQVSDEHEESFKKSEFKDIYSQYMYDKCPKKMQEKIKIEIETDDNGGDIDLLKNQNGDHSAIKKEVKKEKVNGDNLKLVSDASSTSEFLSAKIDKKCRMHKILIFTQFQLILDELENYCLWRGWQYMRLDGSTNKLIRELDIREFGLPDNYVLVYLICTRAGGLGINLVSANHVVMYDEDWNPFVDLQAVDRAHRIGQTRDVCIWKLVTEWSVEERMVFGREQKLKLDKMIIKGSSRDNDDSNDIVDNNQNKVFENDHFVAEEKLSAEEVTKLIRYGRRALLHLGDTSDIFKLNLEELMERKRVPIPDEDVLMQKEEEKCGEQQHVVIEGATDTKADEEVDITDILCDEIGETTDGVNVSSGKTQPLSSNVSTINTSPCEDASDTTTGAAIVSAGSSSNTSSQTTGNNNNVTGTVGDDDILWRSKRTRKPPPPVYNPHHWDIKTKSNDDKKPTLKHERSCFRCGQSKIDTVSKESNTNQTSNNEGDYNNNTGGTTNSNTGGNSGVTASTNDNSSSTNSAASGGNNINNSKPSGSVAQMDEYMRKMGLINCNRCPKSYHWSQCLGLDKVPPRTWICPWHECCLCFRRATQAGGLLIHCSECPTTFCIDCFPPEYQRHQVLDSFFENLNKRGWNVSRDSMILFLCSKCKALQQQEVRKKLSRQQLLEEQQRRRKMNEQLKSDVLKSGQKSFDQFSALGSGTSGKNSLYISGRRRNIEAAWKHTESSIRKGFERLFPPLLYKLQQEYIKENAKHEAAILAAASNNGSTADNDTDLEKQIGGLRKSPWMRPPGEWLRLCDNCILPFHDVSGCPYPLEVVKVSVPSGVTQIDVQTGQPLQLADGTKIKSMEEFSILTKNGGVDSKFQTRSYCSLCGLSGRMHTRRSCPLLPDEAEQEYEQRQLVLENFIKVLNSYPVEYPLELIDEDKVVGGWESYRKTAQKIAEEFLKDCFLACNLHHIITPSGTAYIGRQNVARNTNNQNTTIITGIGNSVTGISGSNSSSNQIIMQGEHGLGGMPAMSGINSEIGGVSVSGHLSRTSCGGFKKPGSREQGIPFSGCTIPTSSSMSSAAAAIQQRMNDAAISLARARYAAAAAAATVVGFRHPQPILPFPIVQTHPYGMIASANPLFFGVPNPTIAAAASAAAVAAATATARARTNIVSGNNIFSNNDINQLSGDEIARKRRVIDSFITENIDSNYDLSSSHIKSPPGKIKIIDNTSNLNLMQNSTVPSANVENIKSEDNFGEATANLDKLIKNIKRQSN
ncbi:SNF2 family N-terminal domain [Cryptosporidium bovis]|uniref:SNF2 family N-terminal domain n=1 Tax=Cryptosporidium bovis TaxID=310047 RepID=UPI00351A9D95|nr:SNF2 family N-terminal domain [Cryptosporidium bovis]